MKSLLEKPEAVPPTLHVPADDQLCDQSEASALGPARWDWRDVQRVLVIRLRSIGDTVLSTPSLIALRRFLPSAQIDILLESWVAPVLEGFDAVDNVLTVERGSTMSRARVARQLRQTHYDVGYNLHGGTTATLLMRAARVKNRVGYSDYQYSRLLNHAAPPASELWGMPKTHSAEQQLALIGWTGVPVTDRPRTRLAVTEKAASSIAARLKASSIATSRPIALIHPSAAFDTKQWATSNFARVAEYLAALGFECIAIAANNETAVLADLVEHSSVPIRCFNDLELPEVTALAAASRLFVGNDSGIVHIAAAVATPAVVIFGSSNTAHWSPWASAPSQVVREELPCQPCHGYFCAEFEAPECIRRVAVERVTDAIDRVLIASNDRGPTSQS